MNASACTATELIAATRKIAASRPGHVYDPPAVGGAHVHDGGDCVYSLDGQPSCLIGHALEDLGLLGVAAKAGNETSIDTLIGRIGLQFTRRQRQWLKQVQTLQDGGESWGSAVADTDENYPLDQEEVV